MRNVIGFADKVHFVSRDMPAMGDLGDYGAKTVHQLPVMSNVESKALCPVLTCGKYYDHARS